MIELLLTRQIDNGFVVVLQRITINRFDSGIEMARGASRRRRSSSITNPSTKPAMILSVPEGMGLDDGDRDADVA